MSFDQIAVQPKKLRVMSGMRTTGDLHVGHYFGALKNFLAMQEMHTCFFGVMDWHGMTTAYKSADQVQSWSRLMVAEFLAWGLDPAKCTLFIQSRVPEHLELYMIFANLTPMGWLERVPTWKDAEEEARQSDTHNLGRFGYPVLQAADIAIYKGEGVPVGNDQISHLELTREIIRRFNKLYKARLPEPKPLLTETPLVPGLDGRKMSKSYGNGFGLADESGTLKKKVMAMPTDPQRVRREDPGEPTKCNVYVYHGLFSKAEDLAWVEAGCRSAGIGCGDCKLRLLSHIEGLLEKPRAKRKELLHHPDHLDSIIRDGSQKAREVAQKNLDEIKGLLKI